ncbi:hypothetical protein Gotur_033902, partial [Gossypium turneri]
MKLYKSFVDGGRKLELTYLEELNLDGNHFNTSVFASLDKLSNLKSLSISENQLKGSIDMKDLEAFINLRELDMSGNELKDFVIHQELNVSSNVEELYFDGSTLNTNILQGIGVFNSLKRLSLYDCGLIGPLPKHGWCDLRNLEVLDVNLNALEGMLPYCFSNLTSLRELHISRNHFQIPLSFAPFANLSNLKVLLGDENKMVAEPSFHTSVPKFQLTIISLSKCITSQQPNLELPTFLYYQYDLRYVDLSHNNFSGTVPTWLLENNTKLEVLILMGNSFTGPLSLPSAPNSNVSLIDISQNKLQGEMANVDATISEFPTSLREINLGNNKFYGNLPRWMGNVSFLERLALSQNGFEGPIPMEFCNLNELEFLDLSENNLFGSIPSCFNTLNIMHVHLDGNRLSGPLPTVFCSISSLVTLDLRGNNLTGSIPKWIGTLSSLSILLLKDNHFHGEVPVQLCKLDSLSIIDLSQNMFSGIIPSCLGNLTLPTETNKILTNWETSPTLTEDELMKTLGVGVDYFYPSSYLEEVIEFTTKSGFLSYEGNILAYMTGIDLSCNNLTGDIPPELGNLSEIHSLNLSHNKLTGVIPSSFAKLHQIESLDLSYNNLSGEIPNQLVEL